MSKISELYKEARTVVYALNSTYRNNLKSWPEGEQFQPILNLYETDYELAIMFMDHCLWNSEDDERPYIEGTEDYIPLMEYVKNQMEIVVWGITEATGQATPDFKPLVEKLTRVLCSICDKELRGDLLSAMGNYSIEEMILICDNKLDDSGLAT